MSWITKIVGGILGSSRTLDTVDNTINQIATGIDKFTYTDQEKAEGRQKGLDNYLAFIETTQKQNSEQSMARRNIADRWINLYLNLVIGWVVIKGLAIKWAVLAPLSDAFKDALLLLGTGTLMVLGFYFGVHLARGIPNPWKK